MAKLWNDRGLQYLFSRCRTPAFSLCINLPYGSVHDPITAEGSASLILQWLFTGAGPYSSAQELHAAFDDLGLRWNSSITSDHTRFYVSGLQADLPAALELLSHILMRPHLNEEELPVLIDLAEQELEALQDNPSELLSVQARGLLFGSGYRHPAHGTPEGLANVTAAGLRAHWNCYAREGTTIVLVADIDETQAQEWLHHAFGEWRTDTKPSLAIANAQLTTGINTHIEYPRAEQVHLAQVFRTPSCDDSLSSWLALAVMIQALGHGSSSRLFTRVREEKGLVYAIDSSLFQLGENIFLSLYTSTTPSRLAELQETLADTLRTYTLSAEEFERAKHALYIASVFENESVTGRTSALLYEWLWFKRHTTLKERQDILQALSLEEVNDMIRKFDWTSSQVTLGCIGKVNT